MSLRVAVTPFARDSYAHEVAETAIFARDSYVEGVGVTPFARDSYAHEVAETPIFARDSYVRGVGVTPFARDSHARTAMAGTSLASSGYYAFLPRMLSQASATSRNFGVRRYKNNCSMLV